MNLKINNLSFSFLNNKIINSLSLEVGESDILCVLGPNGVGKTTFFNCILNKYKYAGKITFDNIDLKNMSIRDMSYYVGFVSSKNETSDMKVSDFLELSLGNKIAFYKVPNKHDYAECLEMLKKYNVEYLFNKSINTLSNGEYQMIKILAVLIQDPKVFIFDEPTSSLDFKNEKIILDLIKEVASSGKVVILSTHNPNHVNYLKSKVLLFNKGNYLFLQDYNLLTSEKIESLYNVKTKIIVNNGERIITYEK